MYNAQLEMSFAGTARLLSRRQRTPQSRSMVVPAHAAKSLTGRSSGNPRPLLGPSKFGFPVPIISPGFRSVRTKPSFAGSHSRVLSLPP